MSDNKLFDSTTLRLTSWYLLILVVLSLLFSLIVYSLASHEFERAAGPRRGTVIIVDQTIDFDTLRQQRIETSNRYLVTNLLLFNIFTITTGGLASYFLARRTLRPVRHAMESQVRFSSDAAHELRTPLAVMQSEIEVELRNKKATKTSHGETLASNLDEVHRLQSLTERLLLLDDRQTIDLQPVSIEVSAIDAVGQAVIPAQAKDINIENNVGTDDVMADQSALTNIMSILIDNAIKYSPSHSTITLTSKVKDKYIDIDVVDEGDGIEEQDRAKIFDRFYRADISRSKTTIEGHGLGLSIARRLAQSMNGSLHVASTPKKGSTFTIRLARAKKS